MNAGQEGTAIRSTPQEEALQQIQHIAYEGTLDYPASMTAQEQRDAMRAKLDRINNIAEGQRPDEDWRPLHEDDDGDIVDGGDAHVDYGGSMRRPLAECVDWGEDGAK